MNANVPPGQHNRLDVSRVEDVVVVQVQGLGNMFLAPTLQSFVESELKAGLGNFVVDLAGCEGMDSTFMGTLMGLSRTVKNHCGWFCLVRVSDENMRLLKMLGVLHMVSVHEGEFPAPGGDSTSLYPTTDPFARQKQIHDAHRLLVDADPENKARFEPFLKALEAELSELPTIVPPDADCDIKH